jgi:hypothetical protein
MRRFHPREPVVPLAMRARMGQRRFTRLTNGFSKKLDNHVAAVALYVAHYNLCRVYEALKTTPATALGVAEKAPLAPKRRNKKKSK